MKKSILVFATALLIFSCSKPTNNPVPVNPTLTVNRTPKQINQDFIGNWNCNTWIVDEITNATHRREIIFSEGTNNVEFSLNDYTTTTVFNQLITRSVTLIDSNYFDNPINPAALKFKGYLLTDSTMNVYQYSIDGSGVIDTSQTQLFKKAK